MQKFTDTKGREWQYAIDIPSVGRVMSLTGVNLYRIITINPDGTISAPDYIRMDDDITLRGRVLFALVADSAKLRGVSEADFLAALNAEILESVWPHPFLDELLDFFPPAKRIALKTLMEAGDRIAAQVTEAMEALTRAAEDLKQSTESSTSSAEPSASTPKG